MGDFIPLLSCFLSALFAVIVTRFCLRPKLDPKSRLAALHEENERMRRSDEVKSGIIRTLTEQVHDIHGRYMQMSDMVLAHGRSLIPEEEPAPTLKLISRETSEVDVEGLAEDLRGMLPDGCKLHLGSREGYGELAFDDGHRTAQRHLNVLLNAVAEHCTGEDVVEEVGGMTPLMVMNSIREYLPAGTQIVAGLPTEEGEEERPPRLFWFDDGEVVVPVGSGVLTQYGRRSTVRLLVDIERELFEADAKGALEEALDGMFTVRPDPEAMDPKEDEG